MTSDLQKMGPIEIRRTDKPMGIDKARALCERLSSHWSVTENGRLKASFPFPDFTRALAFLNRVGVVAERHNHHPDCYLSWGRLELVVWTHDIGGLHLADFSLAAQVDSMAEQDV